MLGASEALGEFLIRHPEHLDAFEVTASPEPRAADAAVLRARLLRSVAGRPEIGPAGRGPDRAGGLRGAPHGVPAWTRGAGHQGPLRRRPAGLHARRGCRTRGSRRRRDRGGPGRLPRRGRRALQRHRGGRRRAGRDRHGQMRCPRTELHFRRRRHLRDRIRRARRSARQHHRHRPGRRHFPGDHVHRPRTRVVGGRRQPASGGQVRSAGPDPGLPRELLRAVGRELGVPGPAQGPDHRR